MTDLARKFGIVSGGSVWLVDAPAPSAALLRAACPPNVALTDTADSTQRYDLICIWPLHADGLTERLAALQWRIVPDGAIWVVMLKKPVARKRGITFTWDEMQAAALQTDLVDNKIATLSEAEFGTRFVIRRERRPAYTKRGDA